MSRFATIHDLEYSFIECRWSTSVTVIYDPVFFVFWNSVLSLSNISKVSLILNIHTNARSAMHFNKFISHQRWLCSKYFWCSSISQWQWEGFWMQKLKKTFTMEAIVHIVHIETIIIHIIIFIIIMLHIIHLILDRLIFNMSNGALYLRVFL